MFRATPALFLLLIAAGTGQIQLSDNEIPFIFRNTNHKPIMFQETGLISNTLSTNTYALAVWVRLYELPTKEVTLIGVNNDEKSIMKVTKDQQLKLRASVMDVKGDVSSREVDSNAGVWTWENVSLMICQDVNQNWYFNICISSWHGIPNCVASSLPADPAPFKTSSVIFMGGDVDPSSAGVGDTIYHSVSGELVRARLALDDCVNQDVMANYILNLPCSKTCLDSCSGPGHTSCNDFVVVRDQYPPYTVANGKKPLLKSDPLFRDLEFTNPDFAVTGWFFQTDLEPDWTTLFRVQNKDCHWESHDCRLVSVFTNVYKYYHLSISTSVESNMEANMAIDFDPINNWVWAGASVCHDKKTVHFCAVLADKPDLNCVQLNYKGDAYTWGTGTDNRVFVGGDSYVRPYHGKVSDARMYNRCVSVAEMHEIYESSYENCMPGCKYCSTPDTCEECTQGFYTS